jgi:hypothetical protein
MRVLVINVSAPHYNLGAHKLADWFRAQGVDVLRCDGDPGLFLPRADRVCLSVIFSWHAPLAAAIALRVKATADVWAGGPGLFALAKWWREQIGLPCHRGLDPRFEYQRGTYRMVFASRGCPVNCHFCLVPRMEGQQFTLDWRFQPAPILCDNNLSALPVAFQEHMVRRYRESGVPLQDANSGFEPRTFDSACYHRWKPLLRGPWRCAFDTLEEAPCVARMLRILAAESPRRKQVYVLIGNEPMAACYERAQKVLEWGGEPYVQPLMPLNALARDHLKVAYDWEVATLKAMQRYYNRHLWRALPIWEYRTPAGTVLSGLRGRHIVAAASHRQRASGALPLWEHVQRWRDTRQEER